MNFNYQKARELMVQNQLRPNKIKDPQILYLFENTPKENFISENNKILYSDLDIDVQNNRGYLKNLHIAQLISSAEINKEHKILHIGALTGYVTFILANLGFSIFAIEESQNLNMELKRNIENMKLNNVNIVNGTFIDGYELEAPYDRIIIDNPIKEINERIFNQLNENSGKIVMIKKEKSNLNKAFKITKNKEKFSKEYLFDVFSEYQLFEDKEGFIF